MGTPSAEVHRGDCWAHGRTLWPVSVEQARVELAAGMRACSVCRPGQGAQPVVTLPRSSRRSMSPVRAGMPGR
ncbi:DUF6233 domain-containing protein [Streptomyces griseus]|uniref:DUF6233 domain-containing protein n=1 Tax=Streptomyces TaxID=1883 RepID=UPI0037BCAB04